MGTKLTENGDYVGLWIDDIKTIPTKLVDEGWCGAYSAWEALTKLELMHFHEINLNCDLSSLVGKHKITGYDILIWLVQHKQKNDLFVPPIVHVRSEDPAKLKAIRKILKRKLKTD